MTAVGEPSLADKCLEFCQALSSQGLAFKFSLTMGPNFSFSVDTRVLAMDTQAKAPPKRKSSPSTIRRNARRREEFLNKKQNPAPASPARTSLCDTKDHTSQMHSIEQSLNGELRAKLACLEKAMKDKDEMLELLTASKDSLEKDAIDKKAKIEKYPRVIVGMDKVIKSKEKEELAGRT